MGATATPVRVQSELSTDSHKYFNTSFSNKLCVQLSTLYKWSQNTDTQRSFQTGNTL